MILGLGWWGLRRWVICAPLPVSGTLAGLRTLCLMGLSVPRAGTPAAGPLPATPPEELEEEEEQQGEPKELEDRTTEAKAVVVSEMGRGRDGHGWYGWYCRHNTRTCYIARIRGYHYRLGRLVLP